MNRMINWLKSILCVDCSGKDKKIAELEQTIDICEDVIRDLKQDLHEYESKPDMNELVTILKTKIEGYEEQLNSYHYLFWSKKPITKPECLVACRNIMGSTPFYAFADNKYSTVSKKEMEVFLELDLTDLRKFYVTEDFDCDDFSFRLKGNITTQHNSDIAFFVVWSGTHAFNAFIDHDKKVWYIEPQTDQILDPMGELHDQYKDIRGVIG